MKMLSTSLRTAQKERFISGRSPRAELVERSFTDAEFARFMSVVDDPAARACFIMMATLGLRVGELCALRGYHLRDDTLTIPTKKGGPIAQIRLPESLLALISPKEDDEPLFCPNEWKVRKAFAFYRRKAGLDSVYLHTLPCGQAHVINPRYRLSLHSLRHYAIQRVFNATHDSDLTRRFARHRDLSTTERYLKTSRKEEIESLLERMMKPVPA